MRKLLRVALFGALMIVQCMIAFAQDKTITGTVLSSDGNAPLAGATIAVKGGRRNTTTDANGHFTITARTGDVLQISHVGHTTQSITVGASNNISIQLTSRENVLGEVVVAMDIKRNPRELGYSVQKVSGAEVAQTQRENFVNGLQGRVAGLNITPTSGAAGASSQIVLRGFNSLSLSNQPLFIVDGVILDNSSLNETSNGGSGLGLASDRPNRNNDYTNRIADLNPNDIESITVLKGPEATALYGSQASSGAIVITTKKAVPGRTSISYDNSFRAQKVTRKADVFNQYGIGSNGIASNGPSFIFFGPALGNDSKQYDNFDHFFKTGLSTTQNLSADFGTKTSGFRFSSSYFDANAVVPTNTFKKYNFRLANTTKIGKFVTVTPSLQYINSVNDKPIRGAGGFLLDLYAWPGDMDVRNYMDANGNKRLLFNTDYNSEMDNPFFSVYNNHSQDKTDRYVATLGIDANPLSWLTLAGRFGYDYYNQKGYTIYSPESNQYGKAIGGYLDDYWKKYNGYNHTITATAKKNLGAFTARVMVGTMWQDYETQMYAISGSNLIDSISKNGYQYKNGKSLIPATFNQIVGSPYDSSITKPSTRIRLSRNAFGQWNESIIRQLAYFGEASIGYKNLLFLDFTQRFESASVFTAANRNYNYPGMSLSAIISDMIPKMTGKVLSFAKLRASLANTARLPDPYLNQSVFVNNFASSQVGGIYSYGFYNNNPDLLPERQSTYEVGGEFRFLNNRISLEGSYYNTHNTNQISQGFRASYATGFVLNTQNAASLRNQGVEATLGAHIIEQKDLSWNIQFNFTKMWSKVLSLPEAILSEYYIGDTWLYGNARGGLIRNSPATTITGFHYARNNSGAILINPNSGLPIVDGTFSVIGDRNPNFTLGTLNSLRYKNWSLNFLWDLKVGGDIFDATEMYLTTIGKSQRTADRKTPRVVQGVLKDGFENSANPTQNNIVINPYYNNSYYTSMPEEEFIQHNVNWFRLRDVTLNYYLPQQTIRRIRGLKSASVFVTGNDLILITNYAGADPAVNGNTSGEPGVGAFGFDYGVLPTPISVNVGIRVGF